ncbi:MAG: cell division protein FtsA [Anaerolineales bacterium]|nr:cell division protein FtsA [Anaerolineales bacterium]
MTGIMGTDDLIFVGLDVGTRKTCVLVGQSDHSQRLRIIGLGTIPTKGMRKGGVVSLEGVVRTIADAKEQAERTSGLEITSALVNLSGAHVSSMNSTGMAGVSGRTIGADDVNRALDAAKSFAIPYNREVVHVIPRGFVIDGQDGIKDAIGMHGFRLEVEAHIVTAGTTARRNLEKCVEAAGILVDGWVLSSLAAGALVLTETEKEMGVVICDIGAGTTDLAIYIEGSVWHTAVIPVGGDHITNDVAQGLHLPLETSEEIKISHGHAMKEAVEPSKTLIVRPFGSDRPVQIRQTELASIIEARIEELFGLVKQEIKRSGYDGLLPAGIVITGGSMQLPGIRDVAGKILQLPIRLAQPDNLMGLVDDLKSPKYSTSLGLLSWALRQDHSAMMEGYKYGLGWPSFDIRKAADFLRRFLPG